MFFYLSFAFKSRAMPEGVSVPRRGFVVFLLTTLELGFTVAKYRFSPPKGIRCFSTGSTPSGVQIRAWWFQSPEGDSLFFYRFWGKAGDCDVRFQSPEGDSLFFYQSRRHPPRQKATPRSFSPPKGIRCFSTLLAKQDRLRTPPVSVPRRGFVVFLRLCLGQRGGQRRGI